MQVRCDHCGNTLFYSSGSDTGIVDEALKRAGWRSAEREPPRAEAEPPRHLRDVDVYTQAADELRDLGMEVSEAEMASWLDDGATDGGRPAERARRGLDAVAGWLERKEASLMPMSSEIFDALTSNSYIRPDIVWQRTAEGLLACSGHCYEQLANCGDCGIACTADEHRGCSRYVVRCTEHGAQVLAFPRPLG